MVEYILPPDSQTLLSPLLACLGTAFSSPRPPPALLPLLSPITRQRVQIFSSIAASSSDTWLRLLSWGDDKAERVQSLLDGAEFEPHPVSGEIEVDPDLIAVTFKRLDEETLHARLVLSDFQIGAIYLWCPTEVEPSTGTAVGTPGWKLAELVPYEGPQDDDSSWSISIGDANERSRDRILDEALEKAEAREYGVGPGSKTIDEDNQANAEDDDYWAQYDTFSGGETPANKTPAPQATTNTNNNSRAEEDSYYEQYADVQPALDNDDPSEPRMEEGECSLNGNIFASLLQQHAKSREAMAVEMYQRTATQFHGVGDDEDVHVDIRQALLTHPRPASASSMSSRTDTSSAVARLELEAESQYESEFGVKRHIGSSIKSLYRLAKSVGVPREEFSDLIRNELELLSLSDGE